jgi:5-(carboxyamino)imidazole ribonucleotide mutase
MAGKVLILLGSKSDGEVMGEAARVLSEFGIPYSMTTRKIVRRAEEDGCSIIIAGAGSAAHLAGCAAADTLLPVIGVPLANSPFGGFDSLLSTVQMPAGIPVATMAVGIAGARNAGYLAAQILSLSDPALREQIRESRRRMAEEVADSAEEIR